MLLNFILSHFDEFTLVVNGTKYGNLSFQITSANMIILLKIIKKIFLSPLKL